jgi:hypothetical protein
MLKPCVQRPVEHARDEVLADGGDAGDTTAAMPGIASARDRHRDEDLVLRSGGRHLRPAAVFDG